MVTISERPLLQLRYTGNTAATVAFTPAEVDIDKIFDAAKAKVQAESNETMWLEQVDLSLGLMRIQGRSARSDFSLTDAAKLVASELARTYVGSPMFDATLYDESA